MSNNQDIYQNLHKQEILKAIAWLRKQNPNLWLDFVTRILQKLSESEECQRKIENNEQQIAELGIEIKHAASVVSGREAVISSREYWSWFTNWMEYLQKAGLSSVPIVTLFAIAGISAILNPFVNPQNRLGVIFLLWSSVSFVLLTSAGIIKLVHRLNRQNWEYKFWGLTVRSWFTIGCLIFGLIEGVGGGALASSLIDNATAQANELRDTALPLLDIWGKAKITAIMSLFACVNIFFSVAKGFEIRVLQPHKIKKNRAVSQLKIAKLERQRLVDENKELRDRIEQLNQEIAFIVPREEWQRDIRNMSNENTSGQDFRGKHPGASEIQPNSNNLPATNNGKGSVKGMSEVEFVSEDEPKKVSDEN